LTQGNNVGMKGIDTIDFIFQKDILANKNVIYATFICNYHLLKEEPYYIRIIVGRDCLTYEEDTCLPVANFLEIKLLLNSSISDTNKGTRFMSADIKDHFLATPIDNPEYIHVKYKYILIDIQ